MYVSALENGTVIDHIPPGVGLKVISCLKLGSHKQKVTLGMNMNSRSMVHKDVVKVEGKRLSEEEASKIAVLAPQASVNIIENYKVVKKFKLKLPTKLDKMFCCPNQHCITNHEGLDARFTVTQKGKAVELICNYCEKSFSHDTY